MMSPRYILALAFLAAACIPRLDIDDVALISCDPGEPCPGDLVCGPAGFCVGDGDIDWTIPDVASLPLVVRPAAGRAGTRFSVDVEVNKDLPPGGLRWVLEFQRPAPGGTEPDDLGIPCEDVSARFHRCEYEAVGDEPEGTVRGDLQLTDAQGIQIERLYMTTFQLDFSAPEVVRGSVGLTLVPGADNPRLSVQRATAGTEVRLAFTVDEPLADVPIVVGHPLDGEGEIVSRRVESSGQSYVFVAEVDEDHVDGDWEIRAYLVDEVGNDTERTLELAPPGLRIRTTPPEPADVDVEGGIVLDRRPWGRTGGPPGLEVVGAPGVIPVDDLGELGLVLVMDDPDPTEARELGRGRVLADGGFEPITLDVGSDRAAAWVVVVDDAGNRSSPRRIRDGAWTINLQGKVAESSFENPSEARVAAYLAPFFNQPPQGTREATQTETDEMAILGRVASFEARPRWRVRAGGQVPDTRPYQGVAYDPVRGRAVFFGGDSANATDETWEWDSSTTRWSLRAPEWAPTPRTSHALVYHPVRGTVLLYGGRLGTSLYQDLWEWDGSQWRNLTSPGPGARAGHGLVYDAARDVVVLVGGHETASGHGLADVWEWHGPQVGWIERPATGGLVPGGRLQHAMAWDPASERVVVLGGLPQDRLTSTPLGDAWSWDTATGAWSPIQGTLPGPRYGAGLAHDGSRERLVLYGGQSTGSFRYEDTWIFEGEATGFALLGDVGSARPRSHAALFATPEGPLLVGGRGEGAYGPGEVFRLGESWMALPVGDAPPERHQSTTARDGSTGRILRFGGWDLLGTFFDDTWLWDPDTGRWAAIEPPTSSPGRYAHAMASLPDGVLLFGGRVTGQFEPSDHTWRWDGNAQTWIDLTGGTAPPARMEHAMAWDPVRQRVVLFGGHYFESGSGTPTPYFNDVWEWSPSTGTWADRSPASRPPERRLAALAHDPDGGGILLFGGVDPDGALLADTWRWDGSTWTELTPDPSPSPRRAPSLTVDRSRRRAVLFGGRGGGVDLADTWLFEDGRWVPLSTVDAPPGRYGHTAAWDGFGVVVIGGIVGSRETVDVWSLDLAGARPGVLWSVPWPPPGVPGGALQDVSVTARVAGLGHPGGEAQPMSGAGLSAWNRRTGTWTLLDGAANDDPDYPATAIRQWVGTPEAIDDLALFHPGRLVFRLAPSAATGAGDAPAVLHVDHVEATARYRLPAAEDDPGG